RKSPVWLRVWHECHWLPWDLHFTKLDEFCRGVMRLCGQRAGILSAPHDHLVHLCYLLFIA
ncbi:hypothetical protein STEG23_013664, partial [Scotinomys teguina]